ncbi:hypothetical protein KDN24_16530 [Bacillus sp. Bva_UNVM-123]|uniref:hypothetical protein n=1 Tax=Bacillus sp. Bva_UNVM-123 TaxID=2829798 RepID=UPI00391F9CF2
MNIQQYYQKSAVIALNASLIALIPPFILAIYGIIIMHNRLLILTIIPFLAYSIVCYHCYLINESRSKEITEQIRNGEQTRKLLQIDDVMIAFLPAPSLRMIIFEKDGKQVGEVKDLKNWTIRWYLPYFLDNLLKRNYGVYDETNRLIAIYTFKKNRIEVMRLDCKQIINIDIYRNHHAETVFTYDQSILTVKQSALFMDYQIFRELQMISRVRKGWLPVEWGKRFKDPNTPILSFEKELTDEERLVLLAIISERFRYSNH